MDETRGRGRRGRLCDRLGHGADDVDFIDPHIEQIDAIAHDGFLVRLSREQGAVRPADCTKMM